MTYGFNQSFSFTAWYTTLMQNDMPRYNNNQKHDMPAYKTIRGMHKRKVITERNAYDHFF